LTVATVSLGGQLTGGLNLAFAAGGDRVPGTVNSDVISIGFFVSTTLGPSGLISISFPSNYLLRLNSSLVYISRGFDFLFDCRCSLLKTALSDIVICSPLGVGCFECPLATAFSYVPASNNGLIASFVAPKPGLYYIKFSAAVSYGLAATYYGSPCVSTPIKHWTFNCADSSSVSLGTDAEWTLAKSVGRSGLNLVGFIKPPSKGLYRFYLRTLTGTGQGDLWIGNSHIIAAEGVQEGSYWFKTLSHHDFQMSFAKFSDNNVTMQVEWESTKQRRQIISKQMLHYSVDLTTNDDYVYVV
jgi:hypothetical protein